MLLYQMFIRVASGRLGLLVGRLRIASAIGAKRVGLEKVSSSSIFVIFEASMLARNVNIRGIELVRVADLPSSTS